MSLTPTYAISTTIDGGYAHTRQRHLTIEEVLDYARIWAPTAEGIHPLATAADDILARLRETGQYEFGQVSEDLMDDFFRVAVEPVTYVNLTPHDVVVYQGDRIVETVAPSGMVARLSESAEPYAIVAGVDYHRVILGEPVGLPEPEAGTILIVSMPMLMALSAAGIHRPDVVYPYGQVRDEAGRIIGCRSLATLGAYPAISGGRHG